MKRKPLEVLRDGLFFNHSERRAAFVLCILVLLLSILPYLYDHYIRVPVNVNIEETLLTQLDYEKAHQYNNKFVNQKQAGSNSIKLPKNNNLNTCGWIDLVGVGLDAKLANKILNYRNAKGEFYNFSELQKVYGMSEQNIGLIEKYFTINTIKPRLEKKPTATQLVNINLADSVTLLKVKGIGPYYSGKIIKYRNMLGGYSSLEQLKEIYLLPDSVYYSIAPQLQCEGYIFKLKINKLSTDELAKHPYINYKTAKLLIAYKNQHGDFKKIEEIEKAALLSKERSLQLMPYFDFE